ncbi:MFS transporter [Specibacter sp. RAF43]|uniref:MFS transporter n=1 Tax=Specibacter sp. RAF43 TaxID=3233057 RepID=UPI003F9E8B88
MHDVLQEEFPHARRAVVAAITMLAAAVLTPVLVGLTSLQFRDDLGVGDGALGIAASCFWLATAASAFFIAPWADRWGWRVAAALGLATTAVAQVGLGTGNNSFWTLVGWLVLAGLAYGLITPTTNVILVAEVSPGRRGLTMGAKQAAAPLAGLLAGVAVPVIAIGVGWRWAYVLAAVVSVTALVVTVTSRARTIRFNPAAVYDRAPAGDNRGIALLAVAGALATIPVGAITAYAALSLQSSGLSSVHVGYVIAIASIASLLTRFLGGWWADRNGSDGLLPATRLILLGCVGMFTMATGQPLLAVIGTILTFSAGWGWPGLVLIGLLRYTSAAAARATGRFQLGTALGAAAGPSLFALATLWWSLEAAWVVVGIVTLPAAILIRMARRRLVVSEGKMPRAATT